MQVDMAAKTQEEFLSKHEKPWTQIPALANKVVTGIPDPIRGRRTDVLAWADDRTERRLILKAGIRNVHSEYVLEACQQLRYQQAEGLLQHMMTDVQSKRAETLKSQLGSKTQLTEAKMLEYINEAKTAGTLTKDNIGMSDAQLAQAQAQMMLMGMRRNMTVPTVAEVTSAKKSANPVARRAQSEGRIEFARSSLFGAASAASAAFASAPSRAGGARRPPFKKSKTEPTAEIPCEAISGSAALAQPTLAPTDSSDDPAFKVQPAEGLLGVPQGHQTAGVQTHTIRQLQASPPGLWAGFSRLSPTLDLDIRLQISIFAVSDFDHNFFHQLRRTVQKLRKDKKGVLADKAEERLHFGEATNA